MRPPLDPPHPLQDLSDYMHSQTHTLMIIFVIQLLLLFMMCVLVVWLDNRAIRKAQGYFEGYHRAWHDSMKQDRDEKSAPVLPRKSLTAADSAHGSTAAVLTEPREPEPAPVVKSVFPFSQEPLKVDGAGYALFDDGPTTVTSVVVTPPVEDPSSALPPVETTGEFVAIPAAAGRGRHRA